MSAELPRMVPLAQSIILSKYHNYIRACVVFVASVVLGNTQLDQSSI